MNRRRRTLTLLTAALLLSASAASAQQAGSPRKTEGPHAGPSITLPRGAGVEVEPPTRTSRAPQTQTSRARAPRDAADAPQKWEYCAITGFNWKQRGFSYTTPINVPWAVVRYFPKSFEEIEGANEEDAIANAFAKLGEDGWEFVAVRATVSMSDGGGNTAHAYFFKRPSRPE